MLRMSKKCLLEKKGSWWEVLETDLSVPLWCYLSLQIVFISTCFHPRCLSLVLLSTMTVALQPSRHPMAQRSSVCCAARWQNARLWEKMWPWSNATEQAMAEIFHTLRIGWIGWLEIIWLIACSHFLVGETDTLLYLFWKHKPDKLRLP